MNTTSPDTADTYRPHTLQDPQAQISVAGVGYSRDAVQ